MSDTPIPPLPQSDDLHVHGPGCNHGPLISLTSSSKPKKFIPVCTAGDAPAKSTAGKSLDVLPELPHEHGPDCLHEHPTPPTPSNGESHNHGFGCDHGHAPSTSSTAGEIHYHGNTPCSHAHPHPPVVAAHEVHLPKGKSNTGLWVAGIAVVAGIGAYLINEYGKKPAKKKEISPIKPSDWQTSVELSDKAEARSL